MTKRIIYLAFMSTFVLWLVFSNSIIGLFYGSNNIHEIDDLSRLIHQPVYCAIDKMELHNDTIELLSCSGWAFVETSEANENREVSIILKNESKCYELKTVANTTQRMDVLNAFSSYRIPHYNIGFYTDYSIVTIPNGSYDVYVYCKENELDYGLADTGTKLHKRAGSIILDSK